jgi:predicted small lipoprotein YifL
MKIKNQKKIFFTVFAFVFVLAGCGVKGRLYQTPAAAPTEKVTTETDIKVEAETAGNTESTIDVDGVTLNGSGNLEHIENEHISKEHE